MKIELYRMIELKWQLDKPWEALSFAYIVLNILFIFRPIELQAV